MYTSLGTVELTVRFSDRRKELVAWQETHLLHRKSMLYLPYTPLYTYTRIPMLTRYIEYLCLHMTYALFLRNFACDLHMTSRCPYALQASLFIPRTTKRLSCGMSLIVPLEALLSKLIVLAAVIQSEKKIASCATNYT